MRLEEAKAACDEMRSLAQSGSPLDDTSLARVRGLLEEFKRDSRLKPSTRGLINDTIGAFNVVHHPGPQATRYPSTVRANLLGALDALFAQISYDFAAAPPEEPPVL